VKELILCVNAGSSSLKFAVYRTSEREERLFAGEVEGVGSEGGKIWLRGADGRLLSERRGRFRDQQEASGAMFAELAEHGQTAFAAAGHRIVHGGPSLYDPQIVDASVRSRLQELVPFAPLHLPSEIAVIDELSRRSPSLPQVVCFDTAFHRRLPEVARRMPLPRSLWEQGVMRYGFHGLSYEFVVSLMGDRLGSRAIIAHLGNGASMVAIKDGAPVDTSMGLTPAGGFMMGTRTGDLDPGIILYLLRLGWAIEALEDLLDHKSGLLGVSALTGDMKTLLEKRDSDPNAAQAVAMFCYQVRKFAGAFAAVLGGLDTLVFTGGIGERAAPVRSEICRGLQHLGIDLDDDRNLRHEEVITRNNSRCIVRVVGTDEDLMIARHTNRIIRGNATS
jgi:acetate kinase